MHFTITSSRSVTTGHFHTVKIPYYMWITNNWSLWSAEELHHLHVHLSLNNGGSLGHHRWLHNQFPPFFYSQLPSGTWWTPSLAIPWCCLPTSSSVCLVFNSTMRWQHTTHVSFIRPFMVSLSTWSNRQKEQVTVFHHSSLLILNPDYTYVYLYHIEKIKLRFYFLTSFV